MNNQWLTIHVIVYIEIFKEQSMADNSWHSLHRWLTIHGIIYTEGFNKNSMADNSLHSLHRGIQ